MAESCRLIRIVGTRSRILDAIGTALANFQGTFKKLCVASLTN